MSAQSRVYLKEGFDDGERPTGKDFADIFDSFLNIEDDKVGLDGSKNLSIPAGLTLSNTPSGPNGTIRFNGTGVELFNGSWSPIAGESGAFVKVGATQNVAYGGGNVGVGTFPPLTGPVNKFDVPLAANTGSGERIRLGKLITHNGSGNNGAFVCHETQFSDTNFALMQDASANTSINSAGSSRILLSQGGVTPRLEIQSSGNVRITPNSSMVVEGNTNIGTVGTPRTLTVNGPLTVTGTTTKNGSTAWDVGLSDMRAKKDIKPLNLGLQEVCKLAPVYYKFNGLGGLPTDEREYVGLIAQDIQKVIPSMVRRSEYKDNDNNELLTYDSGPLTFMLINAVRELTERVEKLEAQLAAKKNTKQ